jgi:hypothetical protein
MRASRAAGVLPLAVVIAGLALVRSSRSQLDPSVMLMIVVATFVVGAIWLAVTHRRAAHRSRAVLTDAGQDGLGVIFDWRRRTPASPPPQLAALLKRNAAFAISGSPEGLVFRTANLSPIMVNVPAPTSVTINIVRFGPNELIIDNGAEQLVFRLVEPQAPADIERAATSLVEHASAREPS